MPDTELNQHSFCSAVGMPADVAQPGFSKA